MIDRLDRSEKFLCVLLGLTTVCLCVMIYNSNPFVLVNRSGIVQRIPLGWIFPFAFLGLIVPFFLRNLGGLLAIFAAGLIVGGTVLSYIHAYSLGNGFAVSWAQSFLCVILSVSAVVSISRMNVDFTNVGLDDLLN